MYFNQPRVTVFSRLSITTAFVLFPLLALFAQMKITGKLIDATTKETLPGVTISIKGKKASFVSGIDGSFSIKAADSDSIEFSAVGYLPKRVSAQANLGAIELTSSLTTLKEVIVTNNVAVDRKTPVALSTIRASQIAEFSPNREFPELLENTPSVYVSKSSGGTGDSRINIRGFDQTNISVMVNGVPVNDMENASVYWSNWSGLAEIGGQIQVQRGLGNSKLSTAAVGGNINIVTKATEMKAGTMISSSVGNDGFIKTGIGYSTGKLKNGFALSLLASRTSSDGYVNGTASEAYNYFATLAYEINSKQTITATITGAPQWHNQRNFSVTKTTYQTLYGNPNDTSIHARGEKYNDGWGYMNGKQFDFFRNFYHKPVANINYYYKINEKSNLSVVLYGSIGRGGGDGANGGINGSSVYNLKRDANNLIMVDSIAAWNGGAKVKSFLNKGSVNTYSNMITNPAWTKAPYSGSHVIGASAYSGISRVASMNEHNWYGTIINFTHNTTKYLTTDAGIDIRIYRGLHYKKFEDSQDEIGADYYYDVTNVNNNPNYVKSGDTKNKIAFNNDDLVKQYGGYLSGTYEKNKLTAFVDGAYNTTSYKRIDYFLYTPTSPNRETKIKYYDGFTAKTGASYRFTNNHFVFGNIGYFEKPPYFSSVYNANNNTTPVNNLKTQKTFGQEIGYGYRSGLVSVSVNLYHTTWKDKSVVVTGFTDKDGNPFSANLSGLTEDHKGVEVEGLVRPNRKWEVTFMGSVGDWRYKNNVTSYIYDPAGNLNDSTPTTIYAKDLKVGNTAQTTFGLGASYEIIKGLRLRVNYKYSDALFANFSANNRSASDSGRQAWQLPAFGLFNAALNYSFKWDGTRISLGANMDNLFDKHYLAESYSDIVYNKNDKKDFVIGNKGSGKSNIVYPGFGRTWVISAKVYF